MVVDKYTKALLSVLTKEEAASIYEAIARIALVAKNPKFVLIVKSPLLTDEEKVTFLSEIAENSNPKFINFLRVVVENKRIDTFKELHKAMLNRVSKLFNTYGGVVEGNVSDNVVVELEKKLSAKFDADIKLLKKEKDLNGIKVFVEVLNVEIDVDEDKIKRSLLNNILKAI